MSWQDVINALTYIINHWRSVLAYGAGGITIAAMLQWIKRKFKLDSIQVKLFRIIKLDGPRIVVIVFSVFTAIGTAINYLINPVNAKVIPEKFMFLFTAAFYVHRFLVSPLGTRIENWLKPYISALEQVKNQANAKSTIISPANIASTTLDSTSQPGGK